MPHLVRFLLRHALIGIAIAVLCVGGLISFDIARLGTLVTQSSAGPLAVVALTIALGITFGSVQMGMAVMLLGAEEPDAGPGRGRPVPRLLAVRARPRAGRF
ncbi:hypothetical protein [Ancylobacter terrae]|uniref:hypothetical protein n=1 Tax=Ancylobacter sp. sgz301288 TaxID=3342077 RepID=UPI0038580231